MQDSIGRIVAGSESSPHGFSVGTYRIAASASRASLSGGKPDVSPMVWVGDGSPTMKAAREKLRKMEDASESYPPGVVVRYYIFFTLGGKVQPEPLAFSVVGRGDGLSKSSRQR